MQKLALSCRQINTLLAEVSVLSEQARNLCAKASISCAEVSILWPQFRILCGQITGRYERSNQNMDCAAVRDVAWEFFFSETS